MSTPVTLVDELGKAIGSVTNPIVQSEAIAASIAPVQVSVGSSATLLSAARATRRAVTISLHAATDLFVGGSGVTTATGFRVKGVDGAALTIESAAAIYGIVATGTLTVSVLESF